MRVAYFTDSLPPITDGVTRTLTHLANALLATGVDFRFFTAVEPPRELPWLDHVHAVGSVPFPPYPCYRVGLPLRSSLDPAVQAFRPDLIHVVSPTPLGYFGILYARRHGLPVVGSFHTDFVSYFRFYGVGRMERFGWRLLAWFYNQCTVTYAPSGTMAEALRAHGIGPVELWERGIDTARFAPTFRSATLRAEIGVDDRPLVLYVGRLVREKNLIVLADVVERLQQSGERFTLTLVGEGPMRAELQRRLPDACFAGALRGEALARWYASADVFVFPSTTETFGNVILEAFASGVPAVGADRGGVRDLIQNGVNGLLAVPDSAPDLARCLGILLRQPELRRALGRGARDSAARYSWPDVHRRLLASYSRVVADLRSATRIA